MLEQAGQQTGARKYGLLHLSSGSAGRGENGTAIKQFVKFMGRTPRPGIVYLPVGRLVSEPGESIEEMI